MAPDRKFSSSSNSSLGVDRQNSTKRARPHSSNPIVRKEPLPSTNSGSGMSALASLGVDLTKQNKEESKKGAGEKDPRVNKERERKPKMDVARASGIMGFSSGRWLDKSTKDTDPKKELDKALFTRMQDLLKKKRQFQKEKSDQQEAMERQASLKAKGNDQNKKTKAAAKRANSVKANQPVKFAQNDLTGFQKRKAQAGEDKIQDDIMNLHEAYQFLMKKYKLGERQAMMRAAGTLGALGLKHTNGSSSGDFIDDGELFDELNLGGDEKDDDKDVFA